MKPIFSHLKDFRIGVLGGGQLGKMLAIAAADWHLNLAILDQENAPARHYVKDFVPGDFSNREDVLSFGQQVDLLTIEIESVHDGALLELQEMGKIVHPDPRALRIIKDKGQQKAFFEQNYLPTSPYFLVDSVDQIFPNVRSRGWNGFVQKLRSGGYDGRGVSVVHSEKSDPALLPGPSVIEQLVDIEKELSVIVARNPSGDIVAYPAVEMVFHPEANLVEFLQCPAEIDPAMEKEAQELAKATIGAFDICGLLAVEMFLDKNGKLLVNEVAPRPHNSGHHTIEAHYTSQFQQHLRAILDLPLGCTDAVQPAVMINVLGEPGSEGPAKYYGTEHLLKARGAYLHLYGKDMTKPYRKMGHVTITGPSLEELKKQARKISLALRVGI